MEEVRASLPSVGDKTAVRSYSWSDIEALNTVLVENAESALQREAAVEGIKSDFASAMDRRRSVSSCLCQQRPSPLYFGTENFFFFMAFIKLFLYIFDETSNPFILIILLLSLCFQAHPQWRASSPTRATSRRLVCCEVVLWADHYCRRSSTIRE
jgi:hypothetical protein